MLTVSPIQPCLRQTGGTEMDHPCPESGAHIPHPSCGKLHRTTQQLDPEAALAQDYWKHCTRTAQESAYFPA